MAHLPINKEMVPGKIPVSKRSAMAAAVRREAGVDGPENGEDQAGQMLFTAVEAQRSAARILVLDSLIKPLEEERKVLLGPLKDFISTQNTDVIFTDDGFVELRTTTSMRVDTSQIPAHILDPYRVERTTHALFRNPNSGTVINGVLKGTVAAGGPLKRTRIE